MDELTDRRRVVRRVGGRRSPRCATRPPRARRQGARRPGQEAEEAVGRGLGGQPARATRERADRLGARARRAAAAAAEALDGEELRALTRQRRQLTTALASSGEVAGPGRRRAADRAGRRPGRGHAHRRDARPRRGPGRAHRAGRHGVHLDRGLRARRAGVVAVPEAMDVRPARSRPRSEERAGRAARRTRRGSEAGRRGGRPRGGRRAGRRGRAGAREVEAAVEELNARRLQLQGEADELRRRLAAIEDDVDQVDEDLEEAEETRDDARVVLDEAGGARRRPRRRSPGCGTE